MRCIYHEAHDEYISKYKIINNAFILIAKKAATLIIKLLPAPMGLESVGLADNSKKVPDFLVWHYILSGYYLE